MAPKRKEKRGGGVFRGVVDISFFLGWMLSTGLGGYFLGTSSSSTSTHSYTHSQETLNPPCHRQESPVLLSPSQSECAQYLSTLDSPGDFDNLKRAWTCSRAKYNTSAVSHGIQGVNLQKTKWKTVLSVEPDAFFEKYLTQYPGDMAVTQPVVIFSHAPVATLQDVADKCKVLDVAIVPDTPGMCVAVTETFHDVASYHMLHAKAESDGTLSLTPNSVQGRVLPSESSYAAARELLLEYFTHSGAVTGAMKGMLSKGSKQLAVACLLEDPGDVQLFRNSLATYLRAGGNKDRIFAVSRHTSFSAEVKALGVKNVYAAKAGGAGSKLAPELSRGFVQAWFAFAAADVGVDVLWQSPGTVWLADPAKVVELAGKDVETQWAFRGRDDPRATPFFASLDFFFIRGGQDRAIHLMHEIMLHADLMVEWSSPDALASYRLAENNARYGTTSYIHSPGHVLGTRLLHHSPGAILKAVSSSEPPMVVVVNRDETIKTSDRVLSILKESKLWIVE